MLAAVVRRKGKALGLPSFGVDFNQLLGNILNGFFRPGLGLGPFCAAHAMQARHFTFGANVFLQQVNLFRRHIELVITAVFDMKIVLMYPGHFQSDYADIFTDTMCGMHDIITGLDIPEMREFFTIALTADCPALGMAKNILLRHHHEAGTGHFKAVYQHAHLNVDAIRPKLCALLHHERGITVTGQHFAQGICLAFIPKQNQYFLFLSEPAADFILQQIHLPMEGRHVGSRKADGLCSLSPMNLLQEHSGIQDTVLPGSLLQIFPGKYLALDIGVLPDHRANLLTQAHRLVKENRPLPLQKGQEYFRLSGAVRLRQRHNGGTVDISDGAFGIKRIFTQRIYFVAKKFHAQGIFAIDGINVHNTAPGAELANTLHLVGVFIAQLYEALQEFFQTHFFAQTNADTKPGKVLPAYALLHGCRGFGQHDYLVLAHQAYQYIHAPGRPFHTAGLGLHCHYIQFRQFQNFRVRQQGKEIFTPVLQGLTAMYKNDQWLWCCFVSCGKGHMLLRVGKTVNQCFLGLSCQTVL